MVPRPSLASPAGYAKVENAKLDGSEQPQSGRACASNAAEGKKPAGERISYSHVTFHEKGGIRGRCHWRTRKPPNKKDMRGCPALSRKHLKLALANLNGRYALRNRAMVVLGIRTGLRISELLPLRIGQVWDGKQVVERLYLRRAAAKGKYAGASIVIHPEAAKAVARWIKSQGPACKPTDYLFSSRKNRGRRLSRFSAWRILHRAFLKAGVPGMAGTHCLRKTFAQNVYESLGGDLFRLSKALRHSSPMTTLAYLSFRQEEIDDAILAT
jgi:integrase